MSEDGGFEEILDGFWPYRKTTESFRAVPAEPLERKVIYAEIAEMAQEEDAKGDNGGSAARSTPATTTTTPSSPRRSSTSPTPTCCSATCTRAPRRWSREIIAMTAEMLHGDDDTGGLVTSGGTESLVTAMFAYREWGRRREGHRAPAGHHADDRAPRRSTRRATGSASRCVHAPLTDDFVVDVDFVATTSAPNTVALVGSAGTYPHGLDRPDPRARRSSRSNTASGCTSTAASAGSSSRGRRTRLRRTPFDFRVPGVTSISRRHAQVRLRAKGSSRPAVPRRSRCAATSTSSYRGWPGGIYSRPAWAAAAPAG